MKRFIILCFAIVAVLTINACEKLPDGTGTLKVEVSGFYYENNVRIYPYGHDDYAKPICQEMAAVQQIFTDICCTDNSL